MTRTPHIKVLIESICLSWGSQLMIKICKFNHNWSFQWLNGWDIIEFLRWILIFNKYFECLNDVWMSREVYEKVTKFSLPIKKSSLLSHYLMEWMFFLWKFIFPSCSLCSSIQLFKIYFSCFSQNHKQPFAHTKTLSLT